MKNTTIAVCMSIVAAATGLVALKTAGTYNVAYVSYTTKQCKQYFVDGVEVECPVSLANRRYELIWVK